MHKMFLSLALAGAVLAAPVSAATVFNFSYSYDLTRTNTITVTGQLIGDQIANTSSYLITSVTGVRSASLSAVGDFTITGVAAIGSINGNDNILTLFSPKAISDPSYYTPSANGIAFIESPGPSPVRISSTAAQQRTGMAVENFGTTTGSAFNITITPAAAAVPEPATWALMLFGFGSMGYVMRRRPQASARIRFA